MSHSELTYFQLLKQEVARQLQAAFPEVGTDITQWKGQEIRHFQNDLIERVNGRVSEKWFYTHIKGEQESLPRIDMLNLLSQYVGSTGWEGFKSSQKPTETEIPQAATEEKKKSASRRNHFSIGMTVTFLIVLLMAFYIVRDTPSSYQFCFVNAYSQQPIRDASVDIIMLLEDESPYRMKADTSGCIQVNATQEEVRFIVKGPYYRTDTIVRKLNKQTASEQIPLRTNDYAWMIRIFSESKVEDWQQQRAQLDSIFRDDARIFQLFDQDKVGMEMYNKQEFINKLTMPIQSLRQIEILEMQYAGDKIKELRFKQSNTPSHE